MTNGIIRKEPLLYSNPHVRRGVLLASAAMGALVIAASSPASASTAACVTAGTTITCTGSQVPGAGVSLTSPTVTKLVISNPASNINADQNGIRFGQSSLGTQNIEIDSNIGNKTITAVRNGIYAFGYSSDTVKITSSGNVTSSDTVGIYGWNNGANGKAGAVTIISDGNVTARTSGIYARSSGSSGAVVVNAASGKITASDYTAIRAVASGTGTVTVTSGADLSGKKYAIFASSQGNVTVDSGGAITPVSVTEGKETVSRGGGIVARSSGSGLVSVKSTGDITVALPVGSPSNQIAIAAYSRSGSTKVDFSGDIVATGPSATRIVDATSRNFTGGSYARVKGEGTITFDSGTAISVDAGRDAFVDFTGDILSTGEGPQGGIAARAALGEIAVKFSGDINVSGGAVYAGTGLIESANNITLELGAEGKTSSIKTTGVTGPGSAAAVWVKQYVYSFGGAAPVGNSTLIKITGAASISNEFEFKPTVGSSDGVRVTSAGSSVEIDLSGSVSTTGGYGISVYTPKDAPISITTKGLVTGYTGGISASSTSANITIVSSGGVLATSKKSSLGVFYDIGHAIEAEGNGGNVSVTTSGGDVKSTSGDGIRASTKNTGAVTVTAGSAVVATSTDFTANGIEASSGSGAVTVNVSKSGAISSSGGSAIRTLSAGNLSVTVGGTATGAGVAGAAGVQFGGATALDGASNSLTINAGGVVNNAGGLNQLAVLSFTGNDAVSNSGTVSGNVDLGTGVNSFKNNSGGVFNMGGTVNLGAGNTLTNAGTLSVGASGVVAATALTGNLVQEASGILAVDLDPQTKTDLITVSGTANLAGSVSVTLLNPVSLNQQFTILTAAGGTTNNGLAVIPVVAARFLLEFPNANDVVVRADISFTPDEIGEDGLGLNRNQTAIGSNMNTLIEAGAGTGPMAGMFNGLLSITDRDAYKRALDQLLPEEYLQAAMAGVFSAQAFADVMMSCREREGSYVYIAQGQCLWMDVGAGNLRRDSTNEEIGTDQTSWWLGGGGQFAVSDTVHAGLGLRYEHVSQDVGDYGSNDGSWGHIGASLKYTPGPWQLAGALSGGKGWIDTDRSFDFGGFSGSTEGEQDLSYVHGKLRAAYLYETGQFYLKPMVDLDVTWMSYGDVEEDGGDGAGLDVSSQEETVLSATPRLEIGGQWELENGALVRPYAQAGVAIYGDTGFSLDSAFIDAPGGTPSFVTKTEMDSVLADISVGLDVLAVEHLNVRLSYDGLFGSTTTSNAGTLRLEWRL